MTAHAAAALRPTLGAARAKQWRAIAHLQNCTRCQPGRLCRKGQEHERDVAAAYEALDVAGQAGRRSGV